MVANGRAVHIRGGIKSLDPPCKEEASSSDKHPFTCDNCYLQLRELQDTLPHRRSGSLENTSNRLGLKGFNRRYAKKGEVANALEIESQRRRAAESNVMKLIRIGLSPREREERLHDSCLNGEDQRLAIDLVRLLKMGVSEKNPVQMLVIRNLVSSPSLNQLPTITTSTW